MLVDLDGRLHDVLEDLRELVQGGSRPGCSDSPLLRPLTALVLELLEHLHQRDLGITRNKTGLGFRV